MNDRMICIAANPLPFEQAEAHLVETMFYDQWAPSRESLILRPQGTFVPRWGDIQSDSEPGLRELLSQKKKRKEAPDTESDDTPQCVRVRGPRQECHHKSLVCCVAQESSGEESNEEKDEEVVAEKDVLVMVEEKLEEINLGFDPQELRPISISSRLSEKDSRLSEKEISELILLLKEFKDVFTWDYSEMLGLDPGLVVHTLNVDPEAKPMAQLARKFHIEIEGQIVKEV